MLHTKKLVSFLAAAALIVTLAGCSAGNKGADTTCGEFNSMGDSAQKDVIKAVIEGEGKTADALTMGLYRLSAQGFCALSSDSATLRGLSGN